MIWHVISHWLLHVTGSDNVSGPEYGFWSGFGSDLTELAIIGGLVTMVRKHNCHEPWCWRVGRHTVDKNGHQTVWCNRHVEGQLP